MIKQNESFLKVLNTFFELLFSGITTVFLFGFNKYIIIFYIVTSILIIGFSIFSWNKTKFLIEDEIFIFENLVFNRTILKIPFSSIVSVDTTQSVKQKIFGVNIFKVNTVNKDEDIQLLISNKNSKKMKELLMKSETKKEEIEQILKVSVFENFIFSMSNRDLIVSTTVWLLIIFYAFEYAVKIFEIKVLDIRFLFIILAFLVIERVITGIFGFVKYYGFNISKVDNNFRVNCGLFDEKNLH
ncbi:MAG: PH domain-containing protein [Peptostreptococcaceae bacterium]